MRFLLVDRLLPTADERHIAGLKAISLADPAFEAHFARRPLYPGALVLEAMVQVLGWLAIRRQGFACSAVLTVMEDARTPPDLAPGTLLRLEGEWLGGNPRGSFGRARALCDGTEVASIGRVVYAHVPVAGPTELEAHRRAYGSLA